MNLSDAGLERLHDAVAGHTPLLWWNESGILHATNSIGGTMHPARCENEADAELVERAVNSYDAMLGALKAFGSKRSDDEWHTDACWKGGWQYRQNYGCDKDCEAARDAIKLVQKGS
ncbi:hypothetical protein LCGC14_2402640 [marine sediment metagenome]|uniref:Uncharacterized protein n=1 Tax=marine sediment metagenome TaxID=412755 RepID=A0A0F9BUX9_9ZZZZ